MKGKRYMFMLILCGTFYNSGKLYSYPAAAKNVAKSLKDSPHDPHLLVLFVLSSAAVWAVTSNCSNEQNTAKVIGYHFHYWVTKKNPKTGFHLVCPMKRIARWGTKRDLQSRASKELRRCVQAKVKKGSCPQECEQAWKQALPQWSLQMRLQPQLDCHLKTWARSIS